METNPGLHDCQSTRAYAHRQKSPQSGAGYTSPRNARRTVLDVQLESCNLCTLFNMLFRLLPGHGRRRPMFRA